MFTKIIVVLLLLFNNCVVALSNHSRFPTDNPIGNQWLTEGGKARISLECNVVKMGGNSGSILTTEQLAEYAELTYLTKHEIHYIFKRFLKLGPSQMAADFNHRFNSLQVMEEFPQLKFNPFNKEIFRVFSSHTDGHFSFEDFLNLCSVMSENCPLKVKSAWAFMIFDFDEDNEISREDISVLIDRLTAPSTLSADDKDHVSETLLREMDLQHTGSMNQLEFLHAMTKMPEFVTSFSFRP